jgi:hypothetical protein
MMLFVLLSFFLNNVIISQANFEEFLSLSISSERIDIGIISPLNSPIEIPGAIKGTIHANTDWILTCSAEGDFLSTTGGIIPIERLSWRIEGGEWVPFDMGEIKLLEGVPTSEEGRSFSIDLRLDLKWIDNAGDFLANIDFTLMKK